MDDLKYQIDLLTALNEKLMNSERIYRQIAECSGNVYLYFDYRNGAEKVEFIGPWDDLIGEKIANHPYDESYMLNLLLESDQDEFRKTILEMERDGIEYVSMEITTRTRKYSFKVEARASYASDGYITEKLITCIDVTKIKAKNDELTYLAYYDSLTGLYNRNKFVSLLRTMCEKAESELVSVEVLFIDIDDFKKINDSIGLLFGDELVQEFAAFLKSFEGDDIHVGRFGSDVFVISIYNPCGQRTADVIYRKVYERLRLPFTLSNKSNVMFTVSAGVAEYPDAGRTAIEVIKNAEIVLYKAKEKGRNTIHYFEPEILTKFLSDITIEKQLKDAIDNEDLTLFFQPQFHADTGKLRGAEALLRWPDSNGGFITSPSEFIPIAEKNGAIIPIGKWVLKESIRIMNDFRIKYHFPFIMSVNISAIQLRDDGFIEYLQTLLQAFEINPEMYEIEITESVFIEDFDDIIEKINVLRGMGIRVALDDFGTGYSSLSYLKRLPIDTLKVDKSFIDTMISDDSTNIITDSVVGMAKKMGFETIAEGVESKEQLLYLQKIKCDVIQGYLLGKPMSRIDFEKVIIRQLP